MLLHYLAKFGRSTFQPNSNVILLKVVQNYYFKVNGYQRCYVLDQIMSMHINLPHYSMCSKCLSV